MSYSTQWFNPLCTFISFKTIIFSNSLFLHCSSIQSTTKGLHWKYRQSSDLTFKQILLLQVYCCPLSTCKSRTLFFCTRLTLLYFLIYNTLFNIFFNTCFLFYIHQAKFRVKYLCVIYLKSWHFFAYCKKVTSSKSILAYKYKDVKTKIVFSDFFINSVQAFFCFL